ncbi:MAG: hypothetical protein EOP49_02455, partial [Sphingobacteriales bacterium]
MRNDYYGNEESVRFRLRLKMILVFLILLVVGTAAQAQCPTPPGNTSVYGSNSWIGYVYGNLDANNPPQNAFTELDYKGYILQNEQFDYNLGAGAVSGTNVCGTYMDRMSVRFRMQRNFTAGYYSITIGGDDGVRLSTNGGATWAIADWNYHSYQTSTAVVYLNGLHDMVLEAYDQGGEFRVTFAYNSCPGTTSTAPTSIAGVTAICAGAATTLTATGGTLGTTGTYQWGTGTVGQNILPDTAASITVSPSANTTYWVRRVDTGACAQTTAAASQAVSVTPVSTAPTSISGTGSICVGSSIVLTAGGGTAASGSTYEWGTGSVPGSNPIAGQTGVSITVSPIATTTYWVRRVNANSCGTTTGTTGTVTVTPPPGDQVSYGSGAWIGYVYSWTGTAPPANAFTTDYRGYQTQPELFDQNLGAGSISGATICGAYAGGFSVRYKMTKNMVGTFVFTAGGDDGFRLSIDGGATWLINSWAEHSYTTVSSIPVTLNGNTNFVLEYYENNGDSRVSFTYATCGATAPTSLTAGTTCVTSGGTSLTANGGSGNTYQWGTGATIGSNILSGQINQSINVTPTVATTYWVRRFDAVCNYYTTGQTITIYPIGQGPYNLYASAATVCSGSSVTLTTDGTIPTGSFYQWGTGNTAGSNILGTSTANTYNVTVTGQTTFWVRIINAGSCPAGNGVFRTVDNFALPTAPTSLTAGTVCVTSGGTALTANGGNGNTYQWGTGTVIGSNIIAGQNTQSLNVSPTVATTYWVRRHETNCNYFTGGQTITLYPVGQGPYNLNSSVATTCSGTSITLSTDGSIPAGSFYQWGTGNTAGNNILGTTTVTTFTTIISAQTTYWVRIINGGGCPAGSGVFRTVNVYTNSSAPTSISGNATLCGGNGQSLTANGITFGNGGGQYQWGTGSTVGVNPMAMSNSQSIWVQPVTGPQTYWVRAYDSTCGTYSTGVTFTQNIASSAATAVSGNLTICSGQSTLITATGGYEAPGTSYQWGTGMVAGMSIISGATASAITLSPSATTMYWVRRYTGSPCNAYSNPFYFTVNTSSPSVAPTSITGAPATSCTAMTVTLTAQGGSGSSTFQWGTGSTAGVNIISGQTGNTYSPAPAATTTYWVRRVDAAPCGPTAAAFVTVNVAATPGTPSEFGINQWNVYGFNGADVDLVTTAYRGFYVQNTLNPNSQDVTSNGWANTTSPSNSAGWNGCMIPNDNFTFVYKRQGFPCGTYSLFLNNWDDAVRVYVDGVLVYSNGGWSGSANVSINTGSFSLSGSSTVEIRVVEGYGSSNMAMTFTKTDVASVAPASVTGNTTSCAGTAITLTANGGSRGTNGIYQWGTGSTILGTSGTNTFSVTPAANTTFWVRFLDTVCGTTTAMASISVTVTPAATGTVSSPINQICRNSTPTSNITLTGFTGTIVKWQYALNPVFTAGVTDIAHTSPTLTGAQIGPLTTSRYFRAVLSNGCSQVFTNVAAITVPQAVTYSNGAWSGTPTLTTPVIITSNLTLNANLNVCACEVTGSAVVTINGSASMIVQREVKVSPTATFVIENNGSLVQVDDDATDLGNITVKRNTTAMRTYDYTYWTSPVIGNTLNALSPNTMSDKYYAFNPAIGNWQSIAAGNQVMSPGAGYIVRAPQGWSLSNATSGVYSTQFAGVPNTGTVPVSIIKSTSPYNLIGNPYPSAIDIDLFITDAVNSGVTNGTVYLWSHNTPLNPA